jgi:WD40 repeat protein
VRFLSAVFRSTRFATTILDSARKYSTTASSSAGSLSFGWLGIVLRPKAVLWRRRASKTLTRCILPSASLRFSQTPISQLRKGGVTMPLRFLVASCVCLLSFSGLIEKTERPVNEDNPTAKDKSLPPGVIARLGTSRFWHEGGVGAIAASSDGKFVATAEANRCRSIPLAAGSLEGPLVAKRPPLSVLFRLWDARTGQELAAAFQRYGPPQTLTFSPDNRSIAVASMYWLRLYDIRENGELHLRWESRTFSDGDVSFTADGKSVATYNWSKATLLLLDRQTGQIIRSWKGPGNSHQVKAALLSPDGGSLAWIIEELIPVPGEPGVVTSAAYRVVVVDPTNGKVRYSKRYRHPVEALFSPDNRLLAVVVSDSVAVLDTGTGKQLCEIPRKWDRTGRYQLFPILHQVFSPGGRTLAVMDKRSGEISCYDSKTGKKNATFRVDKLEFNVRPEQGTSSATFSNNSTLWIGQEHRVHRFDIMQGKETTEWTGHSRPVIYLSFSGDGSRLRSASEVESIDWDVSPQKENCRTPGELLCVSTPLRRTVWKTTSQPDHLGSAEVATYELRDLEGRLVKTITTASGASLTAVRRFEFAGKTLCCFIGDELWLYDAVSAAYLGSAGREAQAISPDGKLVAACSPKGVITLKALETGRLIRRFKDQLVVSKPDRSLALYRFDFSADSKYLATIPLAEELDAFQIPELGPNAIQVWDVFEGREVARIVDGRNAELSSNVHVMQRAPGGQVVSIGRTTQDLRSGATGFAVSPDHRLLALSLHGHEGVQLWEIASGTEKARFQGQKGAVTSLAFSRDGDILASGAEDGTIGLRAVRGRAEPKGQMPVARTDEELTAYWRTLTELDAKKAEQAMQVLIDNGRQTVAVIRRLCKPVRTPPEAELDALIHKLDSDKFTVREQATVDLGDLGELARPAIEKALKGKPGVEARRRLEDVLRASRSLASSRRDLQAWRTIEVLERIGSSEAKEVLRTLARGAAEARVSREAQACLERLSHPVPGK